MFFKNTSHDVSRVTNSPNIARVYMPLLQSHWLRGNYWKTNVTLIHENNIVSLKSMLQPGQVVELLNMADILYYTVLEKKILGQ